MASGRLYSLSYRYLVSGLWVARRLGVGRERHTGMKASNYRNVKVLIGSINFAIGVIYLCR